MKVEGETPTDMSKRRLKGNINNGGELKEESRSRKMKQGKRKRDLSE